MPSIFLFVGTVCIIVQHVLQFPFLLFEPFFPRGVWHVYVYPSGRNVTFYENGGVLVNEADGATILYGNDGSAKYTHPDGSVTWRREGVGNRRWWPM